MAFEAGTLETLSQAETETVPDVVLTVGCKEGAVKLRNCAASVISIYSFYEKSVNCMRKRLLRNPSLERYQQLERKRHPLKDIL